MERIKDVIRKHFNDLTGGQRAVAQLILDEPEHIALHSAKEIGAATGTSETTVIRLCLALGMSGYSMLQDEIRKSLLAPRPSFNPLKEWRNPADHGSADDQLPIHSMGQDVEHIHMTLREMSSKAVFDAVDGIIQAKRIVIVGLRTAHAPAFWLAHTLNMMMGNAMLYRGSIDDANHLIAEMDGNWLVIAVSFPRHAIETVEFVQSAKKRGARILAVSEHELSPIGRLADMFLKVTTPRPTALKGMSVIFSALHVLIAGIMAKDRARVMKRIERYEAADESFFAFVDERRETL